MIAIKFIGPARLTAIVMAVVLASGCASSRGGEIPYDTQLAMPDPAEAVVAAQNNKLAPGDRLQITVFRVDDLTGEYVVDPAGNVAFPLAGTFDAIGLTPDELGREIEQRLARDYLQNPQVSVGILQSTGRTLTVDGAVRQPGIFPVNARMTLVDAIAMARGTDEFSNPRRVAIFRRVDGQRFAAAFDLTSIRRGEMENPQVYSGDIIVVEGNQSQRLLTQVFGALPILALFRPY